MYTGAERMTIKYGHPVKAVNRRRGSRVTQGLTIVGSVYFEPVRLRRMFSRQRTQIQPVKLAASRIGVVPRT